jgi:hypothetical protein
MVTSALACRVLDVDPSSRKDILPAPIATGTRQLACERIRQRRAAHAGAQIALERSTRPLEMDSQCGHRHPRQGNSPIPVSLPTSHQDLSALDVDILHAQLGTLGYSQSTSIHEARAKTRNSTHPAKDCSHFAECKHCGQPPTALGRRNIIDQPNTAAEHMPVKK